MGGRSYAYRWTVRGQAETLGTRATRPGGEKIGITRRGELTAVLVPAALETSLRDVFQDIERIRKRVKLSRSVDVKELIEEGRT